MNRIEFKRWKPGCFRLMVGCRRIGMKRAVDWRERPRLKGWQCPDCDCRCRRDWIRLSLTAFVREHVGRWTNDSRLRLRLGWWTVVTMIGQLRGRIRASEAGVDL